MIDEAADYIQAQLAFADAGVPILVRTGWILAVVDVQRFEVIQSDDTVEFSEYSIKVVDDIISGIADVAGVHTDSNLFF